MRRDQEHTKSVFITGASSGIGLEAAAVFGRNGYRVFGTFRDAAGERALASLPNVTPIQMDVRSGADIGRAVRQVQHEVGDAGLYALINNAGIGYAAPFEHASEERGRDVLEVNLLAPFNVSRLFMPLLSQYSRQHDIKARVVNIASWAGVMGQPFIPFYNASKFGLVGLSESMFYDLGLHDIYVVLASPGTTKTPMLSKTTGSATDSLNTMPPAAQAFYRPLLEHYATLSAEYGQSRLFGEPAQVAARLFTVVESTRPAFRQNLSPDACFVDRFLTRWVPWSVRVAINRRMFHLHRVTAA